MKLDLGCGDAPREGYTGVDLPSSPPEVAVQVTGIRTAIVRPNVIGFDLAQGFPWPFASGSVEALYSSHLIEHLPAGNTDCYNLVETSVLEPTSGTLELVGPRDILVRFMDEAWRVAAPGALFDLRWPAVADERPESSNYGRICLATFQDPTHRRFLASRMLHYFSRKSRAVLRVPEYPGACNWEIVRLLQADRPNQPAFDFLENVALLRKEP